MHPVLLEALDLLDFLLLENLDHTEALDQWDQEESLVLRDILVFLVFLAPREREDTVFLELKDQQVQLAPWVHLVCLANLELESLVPLATLEMLVSLATQVGMALLEPRVCQGQRATLGLLAREHQEKQVRMVPQVCPELWDLKVLRVQLVSPVPLACQVLVSQVSLECQVTEEPPVLQEPLVRRESQAPLVSQVLQVLLVLLVQLVHKVPEDSRVRQANRDLKATLVW